MDYIANSRPWQDLGRIRMPDTAKIHIHAFRVSKTANSIPLEVLIERIGHNSIEDRVRTIGTSRIRIEKISTRQNAGQNETYKLLEFVKFRDTHGPGKAALGHTVSDFDLAPDEFFGEETAALYVPESRWLIVQYNHYGVRANSMASYFTAYDEQQTNAYELSIKLDPDAERRFRDTNDVRRFNVDFDLTQMRAQDRERGQGLGSIAAYGADLNGTNIRVTISVGMDRHRSLRNRVKQGLVDMIQNSEMVTGASIAGRETPDGQVEVVDLLEEKLTMEDNISIGPGRRLVQQERFRSLIRARNQWRDILE